MGREAANYITIRIEKPEFISTWSESVIRVGFLPSGGSAFGERWDALSIRDKDDIYEIGLLNKPAACLKGICGRL